MRHLITTIVLVSIILAQFLFAGSTPATGSHPEQNGDSLFDDGDLFSDDGCAFADADPFADDSLDELFAPAPAANQAANNPFAAEVADADPFGGGGGDADVQPAGGELGDMDDPFDDREVGFKHRNVREVIEMLDKNCKVIDFIDTSLEDALQIVHEQHDMNIVLDSAALEDAGIDPESPINLQLKGVSLGSALRLMLRGLDLTYEVRDEVLLITTVVESENLLSMKVIPVHDILNKQDPIASSNALIKTIISAAAPDSWEVVGGPATITYYQGNLVVAQNQEGHESVAELLKKLRVGIQVVGGAIYPDSNEPAAKRHRQRPDAGGGGGNF